MKQKSETNRIEIRGEGIGEISDKMILERALLLAKADDREEANEADFEQARSDLAATGSGNEENAEDSIAEDDRPGNGIPPGTTGARAPRLLPEDEANLAAEEVEEGIAEAELDTRAKSRHG